MQKGKVALLHRFGQQGGYGVILAEDSKEYLFTLEDIVGYSGGPVEDFVYYGKEVSFEIGNRPGTVKNVYLQAA